MTELELLTTEEAAQILRVHEGTLRRWRRNRFGPLWRRIGRRVLYRRTDLERWVERDTIDRARRPISTNHY